MSKLLSPPPGDIADRQTILTLKCKYGELLKRNIKPFVDELDDLQVHMEKFWFPRLTEEAGALFDQQLNQLHDINAQLWKVEDEIRLRMAETPEPKDRLIALAKAVPTLNDQRMMHVAQINKLFGLTHEEKVYIQK